jgi:hypothetical protein
MGLLDSLFGGGGGGQSQTTTIDPRLGAAGGQAAQDAQNLYNQGTGGIYQGTQLANQDQLVQQGQNQQLQYAQSLQPIQQQQMQAFQGLLGAGDINNPLMQRQISDLADTVGNQFNRVIMPGINQGATGAGQFGSSRQGVAQGIAAGDAAQAISQGATQAMLGGQQTALNAQNMAGNVYSSGLMPSQFTQDVGQQRTAYGQQQLLDQIQRFEAPRRAEMQRQTELLGLLGANPLVGNQTTTAEGGGGGNPMQAITGLLAAYLGGGGNFGGAI